VQQREGGAGLTALLGFGGRHADATENLTNLVPRRLEKNAALHRRLAAGLSRQGSELTIPFEPEKLIGLFEFIAKGLAWYHWKELIEQDTAVWARLLNATGESLFTQLFLHNAEARVSESPGNGTFTYEGAQSADNPQMTVWRSVGIAQDFAGTGAGSLVQMEADHRLTRSCGP
jgi:hypothetical protein